ncbi:MAG TPA: type IV toxin-antitoxin system AbiEi family antitoxin [Phycisphaerae bacterium]|nr:type IV toxin-antitoxin system AbiEi family antitoxin [Phycisphaerae bacterium]
MAKNKERGRLPASLAKALSVLAAQGRSVFAIKDFAGIAKCNPTRAKKLLYQLRQLGWVLGLARGKYLIVPLEAGPESAWSQDSLVVASHLADPAAVAYWSACHHWNWTEQVPRTVFAQTPQKKMHNTMTVLGVRYRFVRVQPGKFFGTVERTVGNGRITITDREKTLVDALDRPDLCGGIAQVAEMLPVAGQAVDWDKLDSYLERMGSGAIYKRLGFLTEHIGAKLPVPDRRERIESWHSRLTGGNALLEPRRPASGPINSRWRIRLNVSGVLREGRP